MYKATFEMRNIFGSGQNFILLCGNYWWDQWWF